MFSGMGGDLEAKVFEYRGEQVAGFDRDGLTMICLPQAYELFLKVHRFHVSLTIQQMIFVISSTDNPY